MLEFSKVQNLEKELAYSKFAGSYLQFIRYKIPQKPRLDQI